MASAIQQPFGVKPAPTLAAPPISAGPNVSQNPGVRAAPLAALSSPVAPEMLGPYNPEYIPGMRLSASKPVVRYAAPLLMRSALAFARKFARFLWPVRRDSAITAGLEALFS